MQAGSGLCSLSATTMQVTKPFLTCLVVWVASQFFTNRFSLAIFLLTKVLVKRTDELCRLTKKNVLSLVFLRCCMNDKCFYEGNCPVKMQLQLSCSFWFFQLSLFCPVDRHCPSVIESYLHDVTLAMSCYFFLIRWCYWSTICRNSNCPVQSNKGQR